MRIRLICIGKTSNHRLSAMIDEYQTKMPKHIHFEMLETRINKKKMEISAVLELEKKQLLSHINSSGFLSRLVRLLHQMN